MASADFFMVVLTGSLLGCGVTIACQAGLRRFRAWREAQVEWDPY